MFGLIKDKASSSFSPLSWLFKQVLAADKEYVAEQNKKAKDRNKRRCNRK